MNAVTKQIDDRRMLRLTAEIYVGNLDENSTKFTLIGNGRAVPYEPEAESADMMIAVQGVLRPGKSHTTSFSPKYKATINEITSFIVQRLWFTEASTGNNNQSALSAAAGTDFDFDEGSDGTGVNVGDRTLIKDSSGNHVQDVTLLSMVGTQSAYGSGGSSTTLLEGTDYELDGESGEVLWLKAIDDDVITPTITSNAITTASAASMLKYTPNKKAHIETEVRIKFYDQDDDHKVVGFHEGFKARISSVGGFTADGESDVEPEIEILPLTEGVINWRNSPTTTH